MTEPKDVEKHIDLTWENQAITKVPLHLALFTLLSIYENDNAALRDKANHRSIQDGMPHFRNNLQTLIPLLIWKCPKTSFERKAVKMLRDLRTAPLPALEAIQFGQRYQWFAFHMTAYYRGWLGCSLAERVLTFSYPDNVKIGYALMHHALKRLHEELHTDKDELIKTFREIPHDRMVKSLRLSLRHKNIDQFIYSIPSDVLTNIIRLVDASSPSPTVQEELVFEDYSVRDYYRFWKTLSALMLCYLESCRTKYGQRSHRLPFSRVLILTPDEIVQLVASRGEVSVNACKHIVRDFTLDMASRRPDVQVRYIVPIYDTGYVYLSPTLVYTSNWEVCLLRNWASMSPSKYGVVIASKKNRLADELAQYFTEDYVKTAVRKKIRGSEGELLGDIDLAVFDEQSGYLAIAELKWLIEPDSFQEESHAREEVSKGIDQLEQIINQFNGHSDLVLKQIFTGKSVKTHMITEVQYFLISDGYVYAYDKSDSLGITVLDYQLCVHTIQKNPDTPTKELFNKITNINQEYSKITAKDLCYHTMKIAGYAFRTPGLKGSGRQFIRYSPERATHNPKSPCFCGSGRSYRNCCQSVESIQEKVTDYE